MTMTAAQHQKQLDDAGELEMAAEREEQVCRERLMNLEPYHYQKRMSPWAKRWEYVGEQDVTEALYDLCYSEMVRVLGGMLDRDPLEAARILRECREKAVNDVIGRMNFEAIVKEQNDEGYAA